MRPALRRTLENTGTGGDSPGLAVFFLRQRAVDLGWVNSLVNELVGDGFTVLDTRVLETRGKERVRRSVAGGNWGRGPWPVSGGDPAVVVVALDLVPQPPTPRMLRPFPALDNARLLTRERLRTEVNAGLSSAEHANVLYVSDNSREAVHHLYVALPDEAERLLAEAERQRAAFATTQFEVLADLIADVAPARLARRHAGGPVVWTEDGKSIGLRLTGRRAKLELVDVDGRLGVKKTFKPGCERFLERERLAAEQFAPRDPHFLPLLAAGDNYLVWPYVEDTLRPSHHHGRYGRMLPLRVSLEAMAALRFVWEQGYAVLDACPDNLIVDRNGEVYLVDFEFLHRYETRPPRFEDSYDIAGIPPGVVTDIPRGEARFYDRTWAPRIGLSFEELFRVPRWRQAMLRGQHRVTVLWPRAARQRARQVSRELRARAAARRRQPVSRSSGPRRERDGGADIRDL